MNKKAFVILNPVAGNSSREEILYLIEKHFQSANWKCEIYQTTGEENVPDVMQNVLDQKGNDINLFVAVGGDGTVSGVAGGLVDEVIPMAILPTGTGNSLARELGISLDIKKALQLITGEHRLAKIDAMKVGNDIYLLNVSLGLSSLMIRGTDREDKRHFGRVAYIWTIIRKFFGYQPHQFDIFIDGKRMQYRAAEVTVANSGAIGSPSLRWSPKVKLDDGQINVFIIRSKSAIDYLQLAWNILSGQQQRDPHLRHVVTNKRVIINTLSNLPVQGDGEFIGRPPVDVKVLPDAVQIIIPNSGSDQFVLSNLVD